eukprot:GFUD01025767.1.p1 GENE.GFUD01025767.1~~GFUD01025767.1.p1  ORF type:complete len:186 (+),score=52.09 GFUD01025767.1:66-623(+)
MCIFIPPRMYEISEKELEAADLVAVDYEYEEEEDEPISDEVSTSVSDESEVLNRVGHAVLAIMDNLRLDTEMGVRDASELQMEALTRLAAISSDAREDLANIETVNDGGLCEQAEVDQEDEEDEKECISDEDSRSAYAEEVECGSSSNKVIMFGENEVVGGGLEGGLCTQEAGGGQHDQEFGPQD